MAVSKTLVERKCSRKFAMDRFFACYKGFTLVSLEASRKGQARSAFSACLIQTARHFRPLQDSLRQPARTICAVCEDAVDVIRIGRQLGPFGAGGGEIFPIVFKQRFL